MQVILRMARHRWHHTVPDVLAPLAVRVKKHIPRICKILCELLSRRIYPILVHRHHKRQLNIKVIFSYRVLDAHRIPFDFVIIYYAVILKFRGPAISDTYHFSRPAASDFIFQSFHWNCL